MSDLDAMLAGIVAEPSDEVRWLVLADWLREHDEGDRADLVEIHRELLRTATEPDAHPEREPLHARMLDLLQSGVEPCLPQRTILLPGGVEMKFSFIPPGSFLMGSPDSEVDRGSDEQLHKVTLTKGFFAGVYPVTQAQWVAVMGSNPSHFKGEMLPVEQVSWEDTQAFCAAVKKKSGLDLRLLTEAEWEYAARAGTTTPFYFGTELNGTQANCDGNNPYGTATKGPYLYQTTPVGSYAAKFPHPWGLCDVHGNVFEWCEDWYDNAYYGLSPATDPVCRDCEQNYKVVRGGSWNDYAWDCRTALRFSYEPACRAYGSGFRLCLASP
jgi:uncharacterized protein (TIGR02996 family)